VIEPLRLSFGVACSADHAFDAWTAKASLWWPADHTVLGEPGSELHFEPRVGGQVFERTQAGREVDWGEVAVWEPPRRVAYLWHLNADRVDATDVEVTFTELDDGSTQVDIVHSGWDRLGDRGRERRDANRGGWSGVVSLYIEACSRQLR
jgi:uncharacterized protein YndB with AHSA1/START domain